MRRRVVLLLRVVKMLEEVEESEVATLVPHTNLAAFLVFVTADDVTLKEVVPAVASLERGGVEEFDLLLLDGEEEVLS